MPPPHPPRVLVTRAAKAGSELADHLRALGAEPILIPAIELAEPSSYAPLDEALAHLESFHWLLFTSANAAEAFAKRLGIPPQDRVPHSSTAPSLMSGEAISRNALLKGPYIAAIGPATARALEKIGLTPDLLPAQAVTESLLAALLPKSHQPDGTPTRFLLIRAEEARELLPEALRVAGAEVTVAPAYRTVIPKASIAQIQTLFSPENPARVPYSLTASSSMSGVVDARSSREGVHVQSSIQAITFTSSSTARNLLTLCEQAGVTLPPEALRISIGPITTATLRELGLPPHAEAPEATVRALAEAVIEALARHRNR